jgi:hypothetical protein
MLLSPTPTLPDASLRYQGTLDARATTAAENGQKADAASAF